MKKMILLMGLALFSSGQAAYAMNPQVTATAEDLQRECLNKMQEMARQFQEELQREREAHAQEMAAEREKLSETEKAKVQLEKEKILRGILLHINVEDKTPIRITSDDIMQLEVLERHVKTDEIYQRLLPYGELFGRTDLGVEATYEDFESVKKYIDETVISIPEAIAPRTMPVLSEYARGKGGEVEWGCLAFGWKCWVNNTMKSWLREMGVSDFYEYWPAGGRKYDWWGNDKYWKDCRPRAVAEYTKRKQQFDQKMTERNLQIARANEVIFPMEAFDRLVAQVNTFLSEGLQDTF